LAIWRDLAFCHPQSPNNKRTYYSPSPTTSPNKQSTVSQLPPNHPHQHPSHTHTHTHTHTHNPPPFISHLPHLPFHSNPSCSLKNSRNAGSSLNIARSFGACCCCCCSAFATDLRRSIAAGAERERQIWASRPSSWRRPLRILTPSKEER